MEQAILKKNVINVAVTRSGYAQLAMELAMELGRNKCDECLPEVEEDEAIEQQSSSKAKKQKERQ